MVVCHSSNAAPAAASSTTTTAAALIVRDRRTLCDASTTWVRSADSARVGSGGPSGLIPPASNASPAASVAARSRAASAPAVVGRWAGFLASAASQAAAISGGTQGANARTGWGATSRWARMSCSALAATNGGRPVSISYSTTPSE